MKIHLTVFLLLAIAPVHGAELVVTVSPIKAPQGRVRVALFAEDAVFLSDSPTARQTVPANHGEVMVRFSGLTQGRYAVSVHHDVNESGFVETNLFGKPLEPYGFSNNPATAFGPPTFDETAVQINGEHALLIHLK